MRNNINDINFDIIDEEKEIVEIVNHAVPTVASSKERAKAEKLALKAVEKAKKDAEKAEKLALKAVEKTKKAAEKAEKLALKAVEKAKKDAEKAEKLALKAVEKTKKDGIKLGKELQKRIYQKQMEREEGNFEIKRDAFIKIFKVAEQLDIENPDQGYSINNIVEKYIELHGHITPYKMMRPIEDNYDIKAAIRAIVYESSPSSMQHWFRYGKRKSARKVCPWIFANKNLAIINNKYNWRKTTNEMTTDKKNDTGLWYYIKERDIEFSWKEDKYGPLPSREQLIAAEETGERFIGVRNH
jgi:hypothetical protein